jgi:hypothetical protein
MVGALSVKWVSKFNFCQKRAEMYTVGVLKHLRA